MTIHAIVLSGGKGTRMMQAQNKNLLELLGKPVLFYSLDVFEKSPLIESVILVANEEIQKEANELIKKFSFKKVKKIVSGGRERQDSAHNGLKALKEFNPQPDDIILIHDGARPLLTFELLEGLVDSVRMNHAAALAIPVKDTIKIADGENMVIQTPDRKSLWAMQTPQGMKYSLALNAFEKAIRENFYGTDDVQLAERLGERVKLVQGSYENIKITTPEDLQLAEKILEHRIAFHEKEEV